MSRKKYKKYFLKHCPMCGENKDISLRFKYYHGAPILCHNKKFYYVTCLPCGLSTEGIYEGDAEMVLGCSAPEAACNSWNMRTRKKRTKKK